MYTVDDPVLALIVRFVGGANDLEVSDEAFMQRQIEAIRAYVESFPAEERTQRAREWIEGHAEHYRQQWQRSVIQERLSHTRCADCPLVRGNGSGTCAIHDRWLGLLTDFAAERITSRQYVEDAIELLQAHKRRLIVAARRRAEASASIPRGDAA